MVKRVVTT